jgi:hypothetical protein
MRTVKPPIPGEIRSPGIMIGAELRADPGGGAPALAVPEKDSAAFLKRIEVDPAGALAAMGVTVSPEEARRVSRQVQELRRRGGRGGGQAEAKPIKVQGEVGVKIGFGNA